MQKREIPDVLIKEIQVTVPAIRRVDAEFTIQSIMDATDRSRPLGKRISSFIAGQSKLSRGIGAIADFITIFVPFGKKINAGRDAVRIILERKQKQMPILQDKPWYQSKTLWSAILVILITLANAAGVDAVNNPETMQAIYSVLYAIAGALGLYGLRDAIGERKEK